MQEAAGSSGDGGGAGIAQRDEFGIRGIAMLDQIDESKLLSMIPVDKVPGVALELERLRQLLSSR